MVLFSTIVQSLQFAVLESHVLHQFRKKQNIFGCFKAERPSPSRILTKSNGLERTMSLAPDNWPRVFKCPPQILVGFDSRSGQTED